MPTLYTLGYLTPGAMEKLQAVVDAGALLVDARFVPASRFRPEWSKKRLQERFGTNYRHAKGLGNENYKGTVADIKLSAPDDPEQGLPSVIQWLEVRDVCLLCACADYQQCHLATVVGALRQRLPELQAKRL